MTTVRITIDVNIVDEDALRKYAEERHQASWFAPIETSYEPNPVTMGDLVYEALIASSENPTPLDYGIELADKRIELLEDV